MPETVHALQSCEGAFGVAGVVHAREIGDSDPLFKLSKSYVDCAVKWLQEWGILKKEVAEKKEPGSLQVCKPRWLPVQRNHQFLGLPGQQ